jgi:AcrR family transcriptional regulator
MAASRNETKRPSVAKPTPRRATSRAVGGDPSRKDAILNAGVEIFGRVPYDEVSIDSLADRAGVAHGLLFHYFGNKRGLYLAVLESTAARLREVHAAGETQTPGQAVRHIINSHLDFIETHPETLMAFLRGGVGADPEARRIIEATRWEGISQLLDVLGFTRPTAEIKMAMRGWSGFLDETTIYWLDHDVKISRKRLTDIATEVLIVLLEQVGARRLASGWNPRALLSDA